LLKGDSPVPECANSSAASQEHPCLGDNEFVKKTAEISDPRRCRQEAPPEKPWMKAFGGLLELHAETKRIDRVIAREFGQIDEKT
jgi:hypothetical protein